MTTFTAFTSAVQALRPQTAIVLGSGLAGVAAPVEPAAAIDYGQVPELVPPTTAGHPGRLAVGVWNTKSVLIFFGRVHYYEGHPWDRVTGPVRLAAGFGVRTLILTNAAGGIRADLGPGSLMPVRRHLKWFGPDAWKATAEEPSPYSPRLLACLEALDPELRPGTYAALTGPCYETPAEIRALRARGADAVGMSTAVEAETAVQLGLEVAAISCITNLAAGATGQPLSHAEVEASAGLAVGRLGKLIGGLVAATGQESGVSRARIHGGASGGRS